MKPSKVIQSVVVAFSVLTMSFGCESIDQTSDMEQLQEVQAQAVKKVRAKKTYVKITVKDKAQATELAASGVDFFGSGDGGKFEAYVTDNQIKLMQEQKVKFLPANSSAVEKPAFPAGYQTANEAIEKVKAYAKQYPNITELVDIGDSWEKTKGKNNNDVWALVVSNKANKAKKSAAVFVSGVHARELITVEINMKFLNLLLSSYGKDPAITQYIDSREIIFVPVANIDGRQAVEKGESMWRKNRHIDNTYDGIDLNRNFAGHWNFEGLELTPTLKRYKSQLEEKDSDIYSGPSAFSEPETRGLADFLNDKNVTVMMDLHAYGNMVIYPPGYTNAPTPMTPVFKKVAKEMAAKNGYRTGTSMELLYPTCGTSKDWAFDKFNAISFTMEMGNDSDGFRPPFSRVEEVWGKNKDVLLYLVSIADNPKKVLK